MRLVTQNLAPNGRRVQMFALEQALALELEQLPDGPVDKAYIKSINPVGQIPVLVLDDGSAISESVAICRFLESLKPSGLFGDSSKEQAIVEMWQRRMEFGLFVPSLEYGHHTYPLFKDSIQQFPEWAQTQLPKINQCLAMMDEQLLSQPFIVGDKITIADITAYCGYQMLRVFCNEFRQDLANVDCWLAAMDQRDSSAVARYL
ncbi:glutathione S-transferase family protein [Aurantivibrio plasticivorans]